MRPSGSPRVAQQPIYGPPPAGGGYPLYGPQTTVQPPPQGAYSPAQPYPTTNAPPLNGFPANGQPYPLPADNSAIPGFPDMAPNILGDRPPLPPNYTPLDIYVGETRTGKFMFGVGVNSDAGVTGQITIDERNFDAFSPPNSWDDILNGTAWRGQGKDCGSRPSRATRCNGIW